MNMKEFTEKYGVHFTLKHTGKMEDMISLSTSVRLNADCQKRQQVDGSICQKCYAQAMMKRYENLDARLEDNTHILTTTIIPVKEWPIINAAYFRFEAFGDLNNSTQVINYFNMCKANRHVHFALWTKNPWHIKEAITKGYAKPKNLVIIVSSIFINEVVSDSVLAFFPFIDKVFTVYDKKTAKTVNINCGARHCMSCLRCYKKTKDVEYINEILK